MKPVSKTLFQKRAMEILDSQSLIGRCLIRQLAAMNPGWDNRRPSAPQALSDLYMDQSSFCYSVFDLFLAELRPCYLALRHLILGRFGRLRSEGTKLSMHFYIIHLSRKKFFLRPRTAFIYIEGNWVWFGAKNESSPLWCWRVIFDRTFARLCLFTLLRMEALTEL